MKNKQQQLLEQIEYMRSVMNSAASEQGVTSPDAIQASQQLDRLMNEFMRYSTKTTGHKVADEKR